MIVGFLSAEEASWKSAGGDAYTAKWRGPERSPEGYAQSDRLYNLVHVCFEEGMTAGTTVPAAAVAAQETTPPRTADNQIPPLTPGKQSFAAEGSNHDAGGEKQGNTPSTDGSKPASSFPGRFNPSPTSRALLLTSPCMRGRDFLQVLKAVGRAAMVGFHVGLVGAVRDITWGESGLTTIVDAAPSGCFTLQEALGGALYRENGIENSGGRIGGGGASSVGGSGVVGVVGRMLALARQVAAAMAHCHRRGVSCPVGYPRYVTMSARRY